MISKWLYSDWFKRPSKIHIDVQVCETLKYDISLYVCCYKLGKFYERNSQKYAVEFHQNK